MPITKSAKKALRQNKKRKAENIVRKKKNKSLAKSLIAKKDAALIPEFYKSIDKSVKTGLIKKRTASRKKSKLAKGLNIGKQ